ncbi:hypothetical protein EBB79_17495 [Parasedimentitalea marina]|uniref:Uncharacterized protein n=1 Tax=Parasedimentitalea marina TaxID=2483033 RepID=A0A3T0N666_9RHOB|nr:hypothetical protein EBB79_17495 [Parasedimentitalea marina]
MVISGKGQVSAVSVRNNLKSFWSVYVPSVVEYYVWSREFDKYILLIIQVNLISSRGGPKDALPILTHAALAQ